MTVLSDLATIEADCNILLKRALGGALVCAFGEDGFGRYGRHDQAMWFKVAIISSHFGHTLKDGELGGIVQLWLLNYDADKVGHILTDLNFEICVRKLLSSAQIDPEVLSWPEDVNMQGNAFVAMEIDIPLLLGWK